MVLKDFPREVEFVTSPPLSFLERLQNELQSGATPPDVIGALHSELQPLAERGALVPLPALAEKAAGRGMAGPLLAIGRSWVDRNNRRSDCVSSAIAGASAAALSKRISQPQSLKPLLPCFAVAVVTARVAPRLTCYGAPRGPERNRQWPLLSE